MTVVNLVAILVSMIPITDIGYEIVLSNVLNLKETI